MKFDLILLCAGKGQRYGNGSKPLTEFKIKGKTNPLWWITLQPFLNKPELNKVIITIPKNTEIKFLESIPDTSIPEKLLFVEGGNTREKSIKNALDYVESDYVIIHDGCRPFVSKKVFQKMINSFPRNEIAMTYTLPDRKIFDDWNNEIIDNEYVVILETPQMYRSKDLLLVDVPETLMSDTVFINWIELSKKEALKLTYPYQKNLFERLLK